MTESRSSIQSTSHFFLPKLKDGDGGQEGIEIKSGSVGDWDAQSEIAFQHVASSLEVPAAGRDVKSVSSIPDMWARPLSMEMALHNRRYPIRTQMIEQWQGMLAAIALAEVRGFDLKAELLVLPDFVDQDRFARSLFELLPSPKNALYILNNGQNPWQELYIFLWNNRPVGMSTPSTLICPSEEGDWSGLPWWSGGRLRSPIAPYDHLNTDEKVQLRSWLEILRQELNSQQLNSPAVNQAATNEVAALLREFQAQLGNVPSQTLKPSTNSRFFGVELRPLRSLSTPIQAIPQPSSVQLVASASKQTTTDLLIIPEPHQIMREWDSSAQSIWIHGSTNLATLKPDDVPNSGLVPRWNVQCLREADLFAPELAFVAQAKAFPGGLMPKGIEAFNDIYEGKPITPLLPINRMLLDFLTPEDLVEMMQVKRIDTTMGPQVQFVLDLPLSGPKPDERPKIYRITKTYPLQKENLLPEVPILEVWPNFCSPTWKEYYTFYYDPDLETFQVNFPKTTESYVFKGIGSIHLPTASMSDASSNCQLTQLSEFPTYIDCRGKGQLSLGLIVLKTPPGVGIMTGTEWKIGVDFGTSFTNVYQERNGTVSQLKLNPLHYQVTDSNIELRQNALQEYFIFNNMELPLSTLLTTRGGKGEELAVLDGRVYIPRDSNTFKPDVDDWIRTNLKWSTDSLSYNRLFLKTLILQITAQAAANHASGIQWSISYPSAFSKGDRRTYAINWRNITQSVEEATGISQNCPDSGNATRYRTESLAVAQYFADYEMPGRKNKLDLVNSTCIDIGGGTSDISIWENNQLIHQCSIQLAGKDIFSQFVQLNPGFLERRFRIKTDEWSRLQGFQFFAKLDVFMRRETPGWLERRRDMVADDPEFQGLMQLMALGLSGMYYYVGSILKTLHDEGIYKTDEITPVFIGGNGGRLLHWLAEGGAFDRYSEVNELFSTMMSQASGFTDIEMKSELSPFPKDEVACGLVLADTHLKGMEKHQDDPLVAGESYSVNDKPFDWNTRMQVSGQIESWEVPDLRQIKNLMNAYHQVLKDKGIEGLLPFQGYEVSNDPDANGALWRETNRELKRTLLNMRGNVENIRIEPPFILGLKALLQVLGKQWADNWK